MENAIGYTFMFFASCVLVLPFYIWYRVHKYPLKKAKTIKSGDLYKSEYVSNNPFIDPFVIYVKVIEIRFSNDGEPWVKYIINGDDKMVKYKELSRFLENYIPCKEERNENV